MILSSRYIYISLIISGGENGFKSSGGIPSIDIALEKIIELKILPGYNLTYENIRNLKVRGIAIIIIENKYSIQKIN